MLANNFIWGIPRTINTTLISTFNKPDSPLSAPFGSVFGFLVSMAILLLNIIFAVIFAVYSLTAYETHSPLYLILLIILFMFLVICCYSQWRRPMGQSYEVWCCWMVVWWCGEEIIFPIIIKIIDKLMMGRM